MSKERRGLLALASMVLVVFVIAALWLSERGSTSVKVLATGALLAGTLYALAYLVAEDSSGN